MYWCELLKFLQGTLPIEIRFVRKVSSNERKMTMMNFIVTMLTDLSTKIYLNNNGAVFVVVALEKLNQQEAVALCIAQGLQLRSPTYEEIREIRKRACNEKRNQLASNTTLPSATGRLSHVVPFDFCQYACVSAFTLKV